MKNTTKDSKEKIRQLRYGDERKILNKRLSRKNEREK